MIKKTVFKITGMHCTSCVINIEGELEDTDGVKSSRANYAKEHVEVEYDPQKVTESDIVRIVAQLGYSLIPKSP